MSFTTRFFCLNLLLGNCLLVGGEDLRAQAPPAKPLLANSIQRPDVHAARFIEVKQLKQLDDEAAGPKLGEAVTTAVNTPDAQAGHAEVLPPLADAGMTPQYAYDYRFDTPARFPLPVFGINGERHDTQGAVIYEGMQLAINWDGTYQVRFVVETPAMPVTLRLQLHLHETATGNCYTLTLPPISIPEKDQPQHNAQRRKIPPVHAKFQSVHHEGYLPVLAQRSTDLRVVGRTGTARFGFGVDVP